MKIMKAKNGYVIVKMNTKQKESYDLGNGSVLQWERGHNFNLREDRCSLAYVIDGGGISKGYSVLLHHLSSEPNYEVPYQHEFLTEEEIKIGFKIFSIPVDMCYCFSEDGVDWTPCKDYLLTELIYKKYKGSLVGIEDELVKNRVYVVKGFDEWDGEKTDISDKVLVVLDNAAVEVIWHDEKHKERRLTRTRHREIIGIDDGMLKEINKGKYTVGLQKTKLIKNAIVI